MRMPGVDKSVDGEAGPGAAAKHLMSLVRRPDFHTTLRGYRPDEVDQHREDVAVQVDKLITRLVSEAQATRRALESEIEALRSAAPMLKVSGEIDSLLRAFVETVSSAKDQAEADALAIRSAAEEYAAQRRDEAEALYHEAEQRAQDRAEGILRAAREKLAVLGREQARVDQTLRQVAEAFSALMAAYGRLRNLGQPTEQWAPGRRSPTDGGWQDGGPTNITEGAFPNDGDDQVVIDLTFGGAGSGSGE
jgi:cell division septum initiation protein DivIVA